MAYPYLAGNSRLREALFAESHDLLVLGKALLPLRLAQLSFLWTPFRGLLRWRIFQRRDPGLLGLALTMSGQMMRQHSLQSLAKVFLQMKPIRTLSGLWSGFSRSRSIVSCTISTHQPDFRVRTHPSRDGFD